MTYFRTVYCRWGFGVKKQWKLGILKAEVSTGEKTKWGKTVFIFILRIFHSSQFLFSFSPFPPLSYSPPPSLLVFFLFIFIFADNEFLLTPSFLEIIHIYYETKVMNHMILLGWIKIKTLLNFLNEKARAKSGKENFKIFFLLF